MKKTLFLFILILLSFNMAACTNKQISTTEDVIKFIEEKGKDNVDWKDFEHLKHEDVGSGLILEQYYLSDSNYLLLIGTSYETKPEGITLYDSDHKIIKEIK
ncbi:hypothetical protein [uncultured Helcococcus sp.]|uniref:hypothetical protein n=1 Tax=uncultured Helcococcus sp. TaxID=1072508 RepID=UPI00261DBCD6|nr:hypothetical protein [uncultured Helcococcus sp.]